ncbi:MAG: cysteine desulfurase family protein [Cyanobium sp.]
MTLPPLNRYLDASATSPPSEAVMEAMREEAALTWANPSSLHGWGLAAADCLERSRLRLASAVGVGPDQVVLCSGGSEAIHLALLGSAATMPPGRLLLSAVEHPASEAAASWLHRQGWLVEHLPVDGQGRIDLNHLAERLQPPTRLVSLLWGQNEVGTLQAIGTIGDLCRAAGVRLHVDAVQVLGHVPIDLKRLPVDLLSCTAHKLQGPRGIGMLALADGVCLEPMIGGGGQERGRRGGTEPVLLAHGFATAVDQALARLAAHGGRDPLSGLRDRLWDRLQHLEGVQLSGADPATAGSRLPHHLSLLVSDPEGDPVSGRALVRTLARMGWSVSSGSACSHGRGAEGGSPVLRAMGHADAASRSGLRISLGPWTEAADLDAFPAALDLARRDPAVRQSDG